jgi:hypothetical protein
MPVPENRVSPLSDDELRAAGALLMLSRPEAGNEAELGEEQGARPLWSRQTMSKDVEVMVQGVRGREEREKEDV